MDEASTSALIIIKNVIGTSSSSDSSDDSTSSSDDVLNFSRERGKSTQKSNLWKALLPNTMMLNSRLSRTVVEQLIVEWNSKPMVVTVGKPPVPIIKAVLLMLWVLYNQESFRSMADRFGFSRGHAHNIFINLVKTISEKQSQYMRFPEGDDSRKSASKFKNLRGRKSFPNVVRCVDGCHINIRTPKNDNSFYNGKGQSSRILQGICDADKEFMDIFCGWPGSSHDSRVWKNSPIYNRLKNDNLLGEEYHLLGDSAYPVDQYIMVPFRDNDHLTLQQKKFNLRLSSSRVVIEQSFGRLKGIFMRLKFLNVNNLQCFKYIVVTARTLHIMIREKLLIDFDTTSEDERFYQEPYSGRKQVLGHTKRNSIMVRLE